MYLEVKNVKKSYGKDASYIQVLKGITVNVDKTKINTENKYVGYKCDSTNPSPIPDTVNNGDVIKVYYVTDESQRKDLSYTVEYYKDGIKVTEDTQTETVTVQVLEPDTLNVDKTKINVVCKRICTVYILIMYAHTHDEMMKR